MSDFSELCPLFETGLYNELYLGEMSVTLYNSATLNWLSSPGDPATAPSSFRFGRTIVVTECWIKRKYTADAFSQTLCLFIGRRTGSGTATQSIFGTLTMESNVSTFPKIVNAWQAMGPTSFTLHTADVLDISAILGGTNLVEVIIQYREK